jgi:S1-C subfamily serine protease
MEGRPPTRWLKAAMLALLLVSSAPVPGAAEPREDFGERPGAATPRLAPLMKRVLPTAVSITARINVQPPPLIIDPDFTGFPDPPYGSADRINEAAGVVIDAARGLVLTNSHAIENASDLTIGMSDGRRLRGWKVASDSQNDIALVRIPADRLSALALGNSDHLDVEDDVVALGNPFGVGITVTRGIVSAKHRTGPHRYGQDDMIQMDAAVGPGSSGGPLVNLHGEIVGITTFMIGPGVGFAIPANRIRPVIDRLLRENPVRPLRQSDQAG